MAACKINCESTTPENVCLLVETFVVEENMAFAVVIFQVLS